MFRIKRTISGFKYAVEGIVHVIRTQRHMQFHFVILVIMLVLGIVFRLTREEILILLFTITLVLIAEMFNTAIEAVVDLVTQTYHPLAKFAKDIAAGAVLITSITASAIGFMLFLGGGRLKLFTRDIGGFSAPDKLSMIIATLILMLAMLTMWKVSGQKGKLLKGGIVSGHSAVGFFLASTITFMSNKPVATGIFAFMLAILVAQSRVEGGIHTLQEVILGAILALSVTFIVYWVFAPIF